MLSISTVWNFKQDRQTKDCLAEIKSMGLGNIELGYTLTQNQSDEIESLLKEFKIGVSSIHNFCPMPSDAPSPRHPSNYYRLSALDQGERNKAVMWTNKTIDLCHRVGGRVVVIHAGTVEIPNDPFTVIRKMYKDGHWQTEKLHSIVHDMLSERAQEKKPYMDALVKSLNEVIPYAREKNIVIGLETRYYPTEMPNFEEIEYLLNLFHNDGILYWHDVGHAEVNERLGIKKHLDFLEAYSDRMVGMHIHGVEGLRDHKAPFTGDMDLSKVLPFLKKDTIKVIESRFGTNEEMKAAVEKLKKKF